jgi:thiamine pyrophosphokinase
MAKVYVFLSSGISRREFYLEHLRRTKQQGDIVICADGGYLVAQALGIHPDYVIGDLDSLGEAEPNGKSEIIKFPSEKDFSDFELALNKSMEFGPEKIVVYGALGGRKDHEITNVLLLAFAEAPTVFIEEEVEMFNVIHDFSIRGKKNLTCSLLSFGGPTYVQEMRGFHYVLKNEELQPSSRGLSNIIMDDEAYIRIERGNLVVIVNQYFNP